jgi:hypothetical protein
VPHARAAPRVFTGATNDPIGDRGYHEALGVDTGH